jgi:hypothetical protein
MPVKHLHTDEIRLAASYRVFKALDVSKPVSTARQLLHRQPAVYTEGSTQDKAKYPSPLTDRDTSMINSSKRSSGTTSLHSDQPAGRPGVQENIGCSETN